MTIADSPYSVPEPRSDDLSRDVADALAGLVGASPPDSELPPFWHWTYLLERPRQQALGADGHPIQTGAGDGRASRMFAGGRLTTRIPLQLGQPAHRISSVQQVQTKSGRSGPLVFVTVRHEIRQDDLLCLVDEQDLVYRSARGVSLPTPSVATSASPAPQTPDALTLQCDPVLLFRFSALTYNAHRIHYDLDYARDEGYPGLVIHGPLQVLLMAEALRRAGQRFNGTCFEYRLIAPAYAPNELTGSLAPGPDDGTVGATVRTSHGTTTATGRLMRDRMT